MVAERLQKIPATKFLTALSYLLSLPHEFQFFYVRKGQSDPGFALSFYFPQGNKIDDDTGKCIRHCIGSTVLLSQGTPAFIFDQLCVVVHYDDRFLVPATNYDLQKIRNFPRQV